MDNICTKKIGYIQTEDWQQWLWRKYIGYVNDAWWQTEKYIPIGTNSRESTSYVIDLKGNIIIYLNLWSRGKWS